MGIYQTIPEYLLAFQKPDEAPCSHGAQPCLHCLRARLKSRRQRHLHPEETRQYVRDWRAKTPLEHFRTVDRNRWTDPARKVKRQESHRRWREKHPEAQRDRVLRWKAENPELARALARKTVARYRGRKMDRFIEDVDIGVLYERDAGICGLCACVVPRDVGNAPDAPTIDHVTPVSKGGEHSYKNTRLAHRLCNTTRGNHSSGLTATQLARMKMMFSHRSREIA